MKKCKFFLLFTLLTQGIEVVKIKKKRKKAGEIMIKKGLSGNQLKILAMLAMTLDHVGMLLFPHHPIFRIIGRLAFPIFAYMIAEGCRYTRNHVRYLSTMAAVAAVCQVVYLVAMNSLYQCILVTFSLSVVLIMLYKQATEKKTFLPWLALGVAVGAVFFITEVLPGMLTGTDYAIDYGFLGVILPLLVYIGKNKWQKLSLCALVLLAMGDTLGGIQLWSLLTLPLLALYNGQRGKWKMKYFFYIYYPLHLVVIYMIGIILIYR